MTSASCVSCGAELRPGAGFCARCGTEVPATRAAGGTRTRPPWVVAALVVAVLVVAGAGVLAVQLAGRTASPVTAAGEAPPPAPPPEAGVPPVQLPPVTAFPSGPADASGGLEDRARADAPVAESLAGRWLPQVASKRPGENVGSPAEVLDELRRIESGHPGVRFVLVRSADWSSFRREGYWVTLAAAGYPTAAQANRWCDDRGFPAADCYAKRLSRAGGPEGNAVPR